MKQFSVDLKSLCISFVLISSIVFASTDPNLVGWWRFDEKSGDVVYDSSGYDNHGTILNTAGFATGLYGNALSLDGYDQTVYIPHNDILKPKKQMTISIWVKFDTLDRYCYFYDKPDSTAANSLTISGTAGNYYLQGVMQTTYDRCILKSPITDSEFLDGNWHLLAVTYDGEYVRLYKNGLEVGAMYSPGEMMTDGNANIYLGSLANYSTEVARFDGLMDDLRIYSRALSADELTIMAAGEPIEDVPNGPDGNDVDPNLLGYWKFDEAYGNKAYDSSEYGKTGTILGQAWHVKGMVGDCLSMSGVGDKVQIEDESHFDVTKNITLSCWVKLAQDTENALTFISKGNAFLLYRESGTDIITFFCESMGRPLFSGSTTINDCKWHHVTATYDGEYRRIYFDGVLNSQIANTVQISTNNYPVCIGSNPEYPDSDFHGEIDNVFIYNRALDADEIRNLAAVEFSVANNPAPADNEIEVPLGCGLTFKPGLWGESHDIYFGTDFNEVGNADTNSAVYQGNISLTSFTPPALNPNKIYYWRVDEVNETQIWKGDVWAFSTVDSEVDTSLIARWNFDENYGFKAYDSSGHNNYAKIYGSCSWVHLKTGMCINTTGGENNKIVAVNESRFDITEEITIALWVQKKDWNLWGTSDTIISKGTDAWYICRDGGWSAEANIRVHLKNVGDIVSTGRYVIADDRWHHIAATYDGSTVALYIDGNQDKAIAASGQIGTTNLPVQFGRTPESNANDCTSLGIRDARIYSRALLAEEIADISRPKWATKPQPGTQKQISLSNVTLSWKPGWAIHSSNLYFSSDYYSVNYGDTDSSSFEAFIPADCNSYSVSDLLPRTTYYWRVDSIRNGQICKGSVWSFYVSSPGGDLDGDINRDGVVNLEDFAKMGHGWTQTISTANIIQCSSTSADTDKISLSLGNIYTEIKEDEQGNALFDCQSKVVSLSVPTEPQIPWKVVTILLPEDADLATLKAIDDNIEFKAIDGNYNVQPVPPVVSWIEGEKVVFRPEDKNIVNGKDVDIYQKDSFWPVENVRVFDAGQLRKYKLAKVAVPLVKYNPVTGQLKKLSKADIDVVFEKLSIVTSSSAAQVDKIGEKRVKALAVNFEQFSGDYKADSMATLDSNTADPNANTYCIITTNKIVEYSLKLNDFIAHKESRGFRVMVITEDQYGDGLSGRNKVLAIRSWLQENYLSENIEYVLLIGNPKINSSMFAIPMMGCDGGNQDLKPTDFMYAELTGDWDINDDGKYAVYPGQGTTDFKLGGVDWYSEVFVGRIPFYGVFKDLDHILTKTIKYENTPSQDAQWRKNTLAAMQPLDGVTGISWAWGEALGNEIFEPNNWSFFKLYDITFLPEGVVPDLSPCSYYNFTKTWSSGKFGAVAYCGHGSTTNASGTVDTSLYENMNDEYPAAVFGLSCSNANPDNQRNISYSMLINGAISVLGWTSYGYSSDGIQPDYSDDRGSAEGQGYEFFGRVVVGKSVGQSLYELKSEQGKTTHIFYWFNNMLLSLYGDPSLVIMPCEPGDSNNDHNVDYEDFVIIAEQWLIDHN